MKKTYHHDNLGKKLLKTAVRIVSEEGLEKITMRALGQQAGVSRSALYRHFTDKNALLCAVAEEGFKILTRRYRRINKDASVDALSKVQKIGMAYIEFAIENPGLYRLMFGDEIVRQKRSPQLVDAAGTTFNELLKAIEVCLNERMIKPYDALALANLAWAMAHGWACLLIDGQIQNIDEAYGRPTLLAREDLPHKPDLHQLVFSLTRILFDLLKNEDHTRKGW